MNPGSSALTTRPTRLLDRERQDKVKGERERERWEREGGRGWACERTSLTENMDQREGNMERGWEERERERERGWGVGETMSVNM